MLISFTEQFHSNPLGALAGFVVALVVYIVCGLGPVCGVIYVVYYLLTLPMRRNERSRLFLDLLEMGLKEGRTAEAAIMSAGASRDPALGKGFPLLAANLERGMRLSQAMAQAPRLVAPQIVGMLKSGERIGDLTKVLPACRQFLRDGVSNVRGALNYLLILAFVVTPFAIVMPFVIKMVILPKFKQVFEGMLTGHDMPAFTQFVFSNSGIMVGAQLAVLSVVWLAMLVYVGGPRFQGWVRRLLPGVPDWIEYHLAWRRKRLQRDFSAMLAILLDAAMPEAEAVKLAAESTGSASVRRRATRVQGLLNSGVKLPEAINAMDDSAELQWHLSNALQRGSGFLRALAGWHESLDARAFQLEQAAAQIATTALVLFNGVVIASVVIGMFLPLIHLINEAVLW
jgi:type II secretory pathway component PulF